MFITNLLFKNPRFLVIILAGSVLFTSCKKDDDESIPEDCTDIHWEYTGEDGPAHWADLCVGYYACGEQVQSPIDIAGAVADNSLNELVMNYNESKTEILNNGHTVQFNYDGGSTLTFGGKDFELLQFHFHSGSEHTVGGTQSPLEAHLVHSNSDGSLAVVGIFFKAGNENALLATYLDNIPEHEDDPTFTDTATFNATDLLPASTGYYHYSGSLTTPPCSEIVNWIVMKESIQASQAQLDKLAEILHDNFRPIQALNGRTITEFN